MKRCLTSALVETSHDGFGVGNGAEIGVGNRFAPTPVQTATRDAPFAAASTVIGTICSALDELVEIIDALGSVDD